MTISPRYASSMKLIHSLLLLASMTINGSIVKIRSVALFTAISATTAIASRTSTMITTTTTMRRTAALNQSPLETLSASSSPPPSSSFIALPLLPFHVVKSRRLRELREAGMLPDDEEAVTDTTSNHYDYSHHDSNNIQNLSASSHYPHGTREEEEIYRRKYRRMIQSEHEHNRDLRSPELSALYQGYGTHYVDLWVGTPPQRQTVIVDTGSGVTAFPCEDCNNCGSKYHIDKFFQNSKSSTYNELECGKCHEHSYCSASKCFLTLSYAEGSSWRAWQATDYAYVGGPHDSALDISSSKEGLDPMDPLAASRSRFELIFGCQTKITGLFVTQLADGILGMSNARGSLWDQMYQNKVISEPSFSLCFYRNEYTTKDGSSAGAMTMGGTDPRLHLSPMLYVDASIHKGTMHGIRLRKLYLVKSGAYDYDDLTPQNITQINISIDDLNGNSVIVDSGTTDTYLTSSVRDEFESVYQTLFGHAYNTRGMTFDDKEIENLPTVVIQIQGMNDGSNPSFDKNNPDAVPYLAGKIDPEFPNDVLLMIPPVTYMEYDSTKEKYLPRIYLDEPRGTVIGANAMSNHDFFFETKEKGRIGIAPSECNYVQFVNDLNEKTVSLVSKGGNTNSHSEDRKSPLPTSKPTANPTVTTSTPSMAPSKYTTRSPSRNIVPVSVQPESQFEVDDNSMVALNPLIFMGVGAVALLIIFTVCIKKKMMMYKDYKLQKSYELSPMHLETGDNLPEIN